MLEIKLLSPRGFCFGVKKALDIVDQALKDYPQHKVYVINEIVHNKTIVERLQAKGVIFTQNIHEIPDHAVVIFSAHGVTPQIRKELAHKAVTVLDATCPLVQRVHDAVLEYSAQGYHIIYIGSKNHDEARGVIAENPDNITVIETAADIPNIPTHFAKHIILTQTTLNMFDIESLCAQITARIPHTVLPAKKDLCHTTTSRQLVVKEAAQSCELLLVIGSSNSSNSKKLRDVAQSEGGHAYLIDSYKDIDPQWIPQNGLICITSGASAPEDLITDLLQHLEHTYNATVRA